MATRTMNQGRQSTYPTKGSNAGVNSQRLPKTERSSSARDKVRMVERAGMGGNADASPMTNKQAKMVRPLGPSNLNTIPDATK